MEWSNGYRMRLMFVGFVAAMVFGGGSAKADFTFGEPTNLGPTVNSSADDGSLSISSDGMELYFGSYNKSGGFGHNDIWLTTLQTSERNPEGYWVEPKNLGTSINSPSSEVAPNISADGLTLFFCSDRSGGVGGPDLWVTTRPTKDDGWGTPVNLGPTINSSYRDGTPNISSDGLELFFMSERPGGYGERDIWVVTRAKVEDDWGIPVNLGSTINSSNTDHSPELSADGLALFFNSDRPDGSGSQDIWLTTRATTEDDWGIPVNLGPMLNSSTRDAGPALSEDGCTLYFTSDRLGGFGSRDLYQAPIIPIVDLNDDGIVDAADMCIMVDYWGTDEPLCDIGPMPWGDGVVDVEDLIVLAEHLFEEFPPVE